ncbi:hypothetical protein Goari_022328, partial [Gossypium aridum]|nr:hypothetical protein [Gossypium aridum]
YIYIYIYVSDTYPNLDFIRRRWIDNRPPSGVRKKTSGGIAYSISACEDNQVAADTSALNSNTMNGAMTYILIDVVRGNPDITYGDLLDQIETRIEDANQQGCFGGSTILSKLFGPNLSQVFIYIDIDIDMYNSIIQSLVHTQTVAVKFVSY